MEGARKRGRPSRDRREPVQPPPPNRRQQAQPTDHPEPIQPDRPEPVQPPPLERQLPLPPVPNPNPFFVRHRDPPIFRGSPEEDVVDWLFRFEQIADYNQWTHEQRFRHIGMCFEGVAGKWHCSLMARTPPLETYDRLRAELYGPLSQ
jgi:hypothetical protein